MIKVLLILTFLTCFQTTAAQTSSTSRQSSAGQTDPKKLTAEQSAELDEAKRLNAKVVELHKEKKYDEELPLAKRVVEIRQRILGNYDGNTVAALINLAELYLVKGDYGEAERV